MLNQLYLKMIDYYSGDPKRIQHFVKVHSFAKLIGECEELSADEMTVLKAAALVHDIGIKPAEAQYGECGGKLQEQLGQEPAEKLLREIGFDKNVIARVKYLVGHHHTYTNIDGMDYQVLVEADFLVNLYEDGCSNTAIAAARNGIFKTKTGKSLLDTMFAEI